MVKKLRYSFYLLNMVKAAVHVYYARFNCCQYTLRMILARFARGSRAKLASKEFSRAEGRTRDTSVLPGIPNPVRGNHAKWRNYTKIALTPGELKNKKNTAVTGELIYLYVLCCSIPCRGVRLSLPLRHPAITSLLSLESDISFSLVLLL